MTIRHGAQMSLLAVTCVIAGQSTIAQQPAARAAPSSAAPASAVALSAAIPVDPAITTGRFANGLRYYIRTNKKPEKRAELRLVVNAGSMLEDSDQSGLAHFVEHMAFNGTKNFPKQEMVKFLESLGMRFGPSVNAFTSFDETVYMLQVPTDKPDVLDKAFLILEDWAHNVSFDRGGNRQGARRRHRGMAAAPRRRRADARQAVAGAAEGLALRRAAADRRRRDHQVLQARPAEEVLHRLVPARPDGGRRGRRLRQGGDRGADQGALRHDPGVAGDQAAAFIQRARSPGHAVRDHHGQGSLDHERHRLQQAAASRPDDGRRVPPADGRAAVRRDAVDAVLGDRAETGRAVPRRQRRARSVRPDEGSLDAQRARQGRRDRARPRGALRRSRARRAVRVHRDRARSAEAQHPPRTSSGRWRRKTTRSRATSPTSTCATSPIGKRSPASSTKRRSTSGSCRRSRSPRSTRWRRHGSPTPTASSSSALRRKPA